MKQKKTQSVSILSFEGQKAHRTHQVWLPKPYQSICIISKNSPNIIVRFDPSTLELETIVGLDDGLHENVAEIL